MVKNKKTFLVCFIGLDGTGKTTQAQALVDSVLEAGIKVKYTQNRFEPHITRPFIFLAKKLFFKGHGFLNSYSEYTKIKKGLLKNAFLSTTYTCFLLADYFFQTLFRVTIPLMFNKSIICDRYIHDTVVDLTVDRNYSDKKQIRILYKFLSFVPKPDLVFLIDLPEDTAIQRKDDIPSIDYLRERREKYLRIARKFKMTILDGSQEMAVIKALIKDKVSSLITYNNN